MRMETKIVQDWRRNNRHSAIYDDRPAQPPPPGTAADIWSYGCLLAEVLTGRKLFQVRGWKTIIVSRKTLTLSGGRQASLGSEARPVAGDEARRHRDSLDRAGSSEDVQTLQGPDPPVRQDDSGRENHC